MILQTPISRAERTWREEAKKRRLGAALEVGLQRGETCGICYEDLNPRSACILRCHHIWCERCILDWSGQQSILTERSCALCRRATRSYYKKELRADSMVVTRVFFGEPGFHDEAEMSLDEDLEFEETSEGIMVRDVRPGKRSHRQRSSYRNPVDHFPSSHIRSTAGVNPRSVFTPLLRGQNLSTDASPASLRREEIWDPVSPLSLSMGRIPSYLSSSNTTPLRAYSGNIMRPPYSQRSPWPVSSFSPPPHVALGILSLIESEEPTPTNRRAGSTNSLTFAARSSGGSARTLGANDTLNSPQYQYPERSQQVVGRQRRRHSQHRSR